eukprot:TRINITY_DN3868_c0_g1_i4.p1 TRINITY_DN3868_c0_g1~~TRINITY_DN3868_c0_g1_i4.p1  ORF type:complete len:851 (+),score=151.19 TRINITY_DN3868_c0_g1_i4:169-2553(+)
MSSRFAWILSLVLLIRVQSAKVLVVRSSSFGEFSYLQSNWRQFGSVPLTFAFTEDTSPLQLRAQNPDVLLLSNIGLRSNDWTMPDVNNINSFVTTSRTSIVGTMNVFSQLWGGPPNTLCQFLPMFGFDPKVSFGTTSQYISKLLGDDTVTVTNSDPILWRNLASSIRTDASYIEAPKGKWKPKDFQGATQIAQFAKGEAVIARYVINGTSRVYIPYFPESFTTTMASLQLLYNSLTYSLHPSFVSTSSLTSSTTLVPSTRSSSTSSTTSANPTSSSTTSSSSTMSPPSTSRDPSSTSSLPTSKSNPTTSVSPSSDSTSDPTFSSSDSSDSIPSSSDSDSEPDISSDVPKSDPIPSITDCTSVASSSSPDDPSGSCPLLIPYGCFGSCFSAPNYCPNPSCPPETPFMCSCEMGMVCVSCPSSCAVVFPRSSSCNKALCWNSECRDVCPPVPGCPMEFPRRCPNGECISANDTCDDLSSQCPTPICKDEEMLCADGMCHVTCPSLNGCPLSHPLACPDGSCTNTSTCQLSQGFPCFDGTFQLEPLLCPPVPYQRKPIEISSRFDPGYPFYFPILDFNLKEFGRVTIPPNAISGNLAEISLSPVPDSIITSVRHSSGNFGNVIYSPVVHLEINTDSNLKFQEPVTLTLALPNLPKTLLDRLCLGTIDVPTNSWKCGSKISFSRNSDGILMASGTTPHFSDWSIILSVDSDGTTSDGEMASGSSETTIPHLAIIISFGIAALAIVIGFVAIVVWKRRSRRQELIDMSRRSMSTDRMSHGSMSRSTTMNEIEVKTQPPL